MNTITFDRLYVNVPYAEKDHLIRFRATHPVRHTIVAGANWEYLAWGRGAETLLVLPGLLGIGEMSFHHILTFESEYRVIAPTPPLPPRPWLN